MTFYLNGGLVTGGTIAPTNAGVASTTTLKAHVGCYNLVHCECNLMDLQVNEMVHAELCYTTVFAQLRVF